MGTHDPILFVRRTFLGGAAVVGGGAVAGTWWPAMADGGTRNVATALSDVAASADFLRLRALVADLASNPANRTLALDTLQTFGEILNPIQKSLIKAVLIITKDQAAVSTLLRGDKLSPSQKSSLTSIGDALRRNKVVVELLQLASIARKRRVLLSIFIDDYLNNSSRNVAHTLPGFGSLGNKEIEIIRQGFSDILSSDPSSNSASSFLLPISQGPAFVSFLQEQKAPVLLPLIASFILNASSSPSSQQQENSVFSSGLDLPFAIQYSLALVGLVASILLVLLALGGIATLAIEALGIGTLAAFLLGIGLILGAGAILFGPIPGVPPIVVTPPEQPPAEQPQPPPMTQIPGMPPFFTLGGQPPQ
jgi:hypothetical protein